MVRYRYPPAHCLECARHTTAPPHWGGPLSFRVRAHLMPGARAEPVGLPVGGLGQARAGRCIWPRVARAGVASWARMVVVVGEGRLVGAGRPTPARG